MFSERELICKPVMDEKQIRRVTKLTQIGNGGELTKEARLQESMNYADSTHYIVAILSSKAPASMVRYLITLLPNPL